MLEFATPGEDEGERRGRARSALPINGVGLQSGSISSTPYGVRQGAFTPVCCQTEGLDSKGAVCSDDASGISSLHRVFGKGIKGILAEFAYLKVHRAGDVLQYILTANALSLTVQAIPKVVCALKHVPTNSSEERP
jgi:hypothetical protein